MTTPARAIAVLVLFTACGQEYGVKNIPELESPGDSGDPGEWEPGTATMYADWCSDDDSLPTVVGVDESCDKTVETGTLDAVIEWEIPAWSNYGEYSQIVMAPVVGQLDDDNADGVVDREDIPDIVVVTDDEGLYDHAKGILRIVPGDPEYAARAVQRVDLEGEVTYQIYPYRYSNAAIGDVDDDGEAEIIIIVQVFEGPGEGDGDLPDESLPAESIIIPDSPGAGGESMPPDDGGGDDGEDVPILPGAPDGGTGRAYFGEDGSCYIAAFNPSLGVDWLNVDAALPCGGHAPAIADLEADGEPEVIVGDIILDGTTGAVKAEGGAGKGAYNWHPETGFHSVPVDLDGDGFMEIVTGRTIYDYRGGVVCDTGDDNTDGYTAVADLDLDGTGEVVSVGDGTVRVFELDCLETATFSLAGSGNGGPPTIADFDGDTEPEIGIASGTRYAVYEPDGTVLWSAVVEDESSAATGSSVYDFEGDGRSEVVYADETHLYIFDGATGDVRYSSDRHASRTLHELPTVADVDGDGLPEVIVPNGGGHQGENRNGLWVLGSADDSWLPGLQVWNQHAFSITNINNDLSVPAPARSNWPLYNNFRSGDPQPVSGSSAPDVIPLAEICTSECETGTLVVKVKLGNEGAAIMRRDVPLSLYAQTSDGTRTYLGSAFTVAEVSPTATSDTVTLRVDWTAYQGQDLVVVADDEEGLKWVPECHEDNNELVFAAPDCAG